MARLLEKLPFIRLWDWADGDKYTIDEDNTILTPELAASDKKTDAEHDQHFKPNKSQGNSGKGKSQFKEETKVSKEQLKTQPKAGKVANKQQKTEQKEIAD